MKGFRFRKLQNIGAAGAEEDEYLSDCFVDNGYLAHLEDIADRRLILLGRTGSGKTALLRILSSKRDNHTIEISPENLALTYVSNSNVLEFFANLGVNLDPFFKLLWRHVIAVEILSRHQKGRGTNEEKSLLTWLRSLFAGSERKDAEMQNTISYLEDWGSSFWRETEFRVKEITQKLETDLTNTTEARVGTEVAKLLSASGSLSEARRDSMSEQVKLELRQLGQQVVSNAQVNDLTKLIEMLDQVLNTSVHEYYVLIDGLDENWVEENLRYRLIMALLQTAKDFIKVRRAKIIIALRRDLLERVFKITRDAGFQEEKYDSLQLAITWDGEDLIEVLNKRIEKLVRQSYTKQTVTHVDLLPKQINKQDISKYIIDRTKRPRDIIAFFNQCITSAPDLRKLTTKELKIAEAQYSRLRLRALGDEWSADYPSLLDFSKILQKRRPAIRASELQDDQIAEICLNVVIEGKDKGTLGEAATKVVNETMAVSEFRSVLIKTFYLTGLVGLKLKTFDAISWVDDHGSTTAASIGEDAHFYVHPTFKRALGINSGKS